VSAASSSPDQIKTFPDGEGVLSGQTFPEETVAAKESAMVVLP
jgi:hypothetical protein